MEQTPGTVLAAIADRVGRRTSIALCLSVLSVIVTGIAWAGLTVGGGNNYPLRPIKLVVPAAVGASPDIFARIIGEPLGQALGQRLVLVNQHGAGGAIAARTVATAAPDGYTLFWGASLVFAALPEIQRRLPFDVNEFVPIGFVGEQPFAIAAASNLGIGSLEDLVKLSRARRGGINAAVSTRGGLAHLTAEWLRMRSGAELTPIFYPGTAHAVNDVLGGRADIVIAALPGMAGQVETGALRLLAVASAQRLPEYPELPTVSEFLPDFTASGWFVLAAPPGTPAEIVDKIRSPLREITTRPDIVRKLANLGAYTRQLSAADLALFMAKERRLWSGILKQIEVRND